MHIDFKHIFYWSPYGNRDEKYVWEIKAKQLGGTV